MGLSLSLPDVLTVLAILGAPMGEPVGFPVEKGGQGWLLPNSFSGRMSSRF
jgi:hypothetical protein